MADKIMFKNEKSCVVIHEDKLYILSQKCKDYSIRAVTVVSGFQIELGRNMSDIIEALKETRLPVILRQVTNTNGLTYYQVVRMHTGKVDDKIVANIACKDGVIFSISFNRNLLTDNNYRRYNRLSVFHQIALPYNLENSGCTCRSEQVDKVLKALIPLTGTIEIDEDANKLSAVINEDGQKLRFLFILNKNNSNRYELTSISLIK